jgi:hypothetical protein
VWRETLERSGRLHDISAALDRLKRIGVRRVCWLRPNEEARPRTYVLTYLLTYLLAYLLTYLLTHLLTYLLTYLPTYLLTMATRCVPARGLTPVHAGHRSRSPSAALYSRMRCAPTGGYTGER